MGENDLLHCAAAILVRAAARIRAAAHVDVRAGVPLAVAALSSVECRPLGRGRAAMSMAASSAAFVVAALLCIRAATAFLASPPPGLHSTTSLALRNVAHTPSFLHGARCPNSLTASAQRRRSLAGGGGPAMCGDPAPVDPALAAALLHLGVARALHDLERLGIGGPRGGSSRVVVRCGRVVPDPRDSWQAEARRGLRRLRSAVRQPDRAAAAAAAAATTTLGRAGGVRGTATLVRRTAEDAVRPRVLGPPRNPPCAACCGPRRVAAPVPIASSAVAFAEAHDVKGWNRPHHRGRRCAASSPPALRRRRPDPRRHPPGLGGCAPHAASPVPPPSTHAGPQTHEDTYLHVRTAHSAQDAAVQCRLRLLSRQEGCQRAMRVCGGLCFHVSACLI